LLVAEQRSAYLTVVMCNLYFYAIAAIRSNSIRKL